MASLRGLTTVQRQRRFDGFDCPPWICAVYCPTWNSRRHGQMTKALQVWRRNICSNGDSGTLHIADSMAQTIQTPGANSSHDESPKQVINVPYLKTRKDRVTVARLRMRNTV